MTLMVFRVGQRVYISDSSNGANLENVGTVLRVANDWVYLADTVSNAVTCLRDHIFNGLGFAGSIVSSTTAQQGQVYCLTRSGKMAWKYPGDGAKSSEQIAAVKSSPVVDSQTGNIFIATTDALIIALDANGRKLWDFAVQLPAGVSGSPEITSSPALDGLGHLFIGISVPSTNKGYLLALNTAPSSQQRQLWLQPFNGPITASPMISDVNQAPRIFVGIDDFSVDFDEQNMARFFAVDPKDGSIISSAITAAINQYCSGGTRSK